MDTETATLYAEVMLGEDTDSFFQSDIGRYVLARCQEEVDTAVEKLKNVEFYKSQEVAELQMKIKTAESAVIWLNETLAAGRQALQLLDEGE